MPQQQRQIDFNRGAQLRILERAVIGDLPPERRTRRIRNQGTLKAILKALESFQREGASCFPSVPTLAIHTGFSRRTIQRGLRLLADQGLVSITPTRRQNGSSASNSYAVNWLPLLDSAASTDSQDTSGQEIRSGESAGGGGGVNTTRGGVNLTGGGRQADAPSKHQHKRPWKRKTHVTADVFSREKKLEEGKTETAHRESTARSAVRPDSRAKTFWGRPQPLTKADLTTGPIVAELFRFAVARGWGGLQETERDERTFFALARFCGHKATDPADAGKYLTYCLKQQLYGNIREEDDEAARRYLAGVREQRAGTRNHELQTVATSLFMAPPADEPKPDWRAELNRRAALERSKRPCP